MEAIKLLMLLLLVKLSICDDPPATTQHIWWSYGQIKLTKIKQGLIDRLLYPAEYKLQLNESSTSNKITPREFMVDSIECNTCRFPQSKGEL